MFGYYISHILHTAVTQFDCILIKYFMISVMFRKVLYNKLHKDLSYICLDMATAWRVKPYNFSCSYTFNRTLFTVLNFLTETTLS